jgi:hypothetical protein
MPLLGGAGADDGGRVTNPIVPLYAADAAACSAVSTIPGLCAALATLLPQVRRYRLNR